jgi:hypothetical protein
MVTGHNCAGSVLYPITIGDFVLADMTDSALNGVVAGFPSYYRKHVGATDGTNSIYVWIVLKMTVLFILQTLRIRGATSLTCPCSARMHSL